MDRMKKAGYAGFITLCALFVWPVDGAHAYLDPGTGSFVLQAMIAALAGALLALKIFWAKVKAFFAGLFGGKRARKK